VEPLVVFLVPLGGQRYELYYERPQTDADETTPESGDGWFAGMRQKFNVMLKQAEAGDETAEPSEGWVARGRARMMAWVAERIAEQRLLWNLRGCDAAVVTHPDDMPFEPVMAIVRQSLRADHRRHMRWLIVDTILFVVSGILFFIPGPNLVAYFFAFRLVGHWLSMRGAAHGRDRTSWSGRSSPQMTALRAAVARPAHERGRAIEPIAEDLGLTRLVLFVDRMCGAKAS
jgi:hypothetical protein